MLKHMRAIVFLFGAFLLTGCQSQNTLSSAPQVSIEDAKNLKINFQIGGHRAPPRTINELRAAFGTGRMAPGNCDAVWTRRQEKVEQLIKLIRNTNPGSGRIVEDRVRQMNDLIDEIIDVGEYAKAIAALEATLSMASSITEQERLAMLYAQIARIKAQIGDQKGAAAAAADAGQKMSKSRLGLDSAWGLIFLNSAKAFVAHGDGDLTTAEHHYRKSISAVKYSSIYSDHGKISIYALQTALIQNLMQQGTMNVAEAEAYAAVKGLKIKSPKSFRYSGKWAGPVIMLASVLMEQGKTQDAEYLANTAINMHQVGCSSPASMGWTYAGKVLSAVLAQKGKWTEVLAQREIMRTQLRNFPAVFEQGFADNLDWAEAEVYAGDSKRGIGQIQKIMDARLIELGPESYGYAETLGLMAGAKTFSGRRDKAKKLYASALPALLRKTSIREHDSGRTSAVGRRDRILGRYMEILKIDAERGDGGAAEELLRLASASRLSTVQQAYQANAVRSAAKAPELITLVRQDQDVSEELKSVLNTLASILSSPDAKSKSVSVPTLRRRLVKLRAARKVLRLEITAQFPEFDNFINPRPLTVKQMRAALRADQALINFHVMNDLTYVWALTKFGPMQFARVDLGRENLSSMIGALRKAVDPGAIPSLQELPEFNTRLAYQLYQALFKPVEAGFRDASELLIVADGPLGTLPFSMLTTTPALAVKDDTVLFDRYRNVDWLAKNKALTLLPSVNTLSLLSAAPVTTATKQQAFIGFGDPFFNASQALAASKEGPIQLADGRQSRGIGGGFNAKPQTRSVDSASYGLLPRLPDTQWELTRIAQTLGLDPTKVIYTGKQANEDRVKTMDLTPYRIISFATHGLIPGDLDGLDQPALALTAPEVAGIKGDGLLTVDEILGLKLNADWAVLSACNTAAGDGAGAEAVSGLGRAFFYAGARALLVSNWPVHSGATAHLMATLFQLQKSNPSLGRSAALQKTRNTMIENGVQSDIKGNPLFSYAHPIFWAPFTIVGDGGGAEVGS